MCGLPTVPLRIADPQIRRRSADVSDRKRLTSDHRLTADKNYNFGNLLRVAVVAEWSFNMNCCNTQSTKRQSMLCVIVNKRVNRPSHKRITHASCGVDTFLPTGMSRCGLHLSDILSQENASGDNKTVSFSGTKILRNMAVNWIKANLWNRWEAYIVKSAADGSLTTMPPISWPSDP